MADQFTEYLRSGELKQPEPPEKLVKKVLLDLAHRERTKASKIKVLNMQQKKTVTNIEKIKARLLKNLPLLEQQREILKANKFLRQAGQDLIEVDLNIPSVSSESEGPAQPVETISDEERLRRSSVRSDLKMRIQDSNALDSGPRHKPETKKRELGERFFEPKRMTIKHYSVPVPNKKGYSRKYDITDKDYDDAHEERVKTQKKDERKQICTFVKTQLTQRAIKRHSSQEQFGGARTPSEIERRN